MNYVAMWPKDDKSTHVVYLTHIARKAWEALEEMGDHRWDALQAVVKVCPHCSWSIKQKPFETVKKEILDKYEILNDAVI